MGLDDVLHPWYLEEQVTHARRLGQTRAVALCRAACRSGGPGGGQHAWGVGQIGTRGAALLPATLSRACQQLPCPRLQAGLGGLRCCQPPCHTPPNSCPSPACRRGVPASERPLMWAAALGLQLHGTARAIGADTQDGAAAAPSPAGAAAGEGSGRLLPWCLRDEQVCACGG
jgi:hypothetical protein